MQIHSCGKKEKNVLLDNLNKFDIIVVNFLLMITWHLVILIICMSLPRSFFEPTKRLYLTRKWEKNGNLYVKTLKIKKWKDCLPQFVAKGGFSKKHLPSSKDFDENYIHVFISETCRAEWNHLMCSMYFIISFLINSIQNAIIFSLIPIFCNLPFLIIQRYNRIRLLKLEKRYSSERYVEKISV